MSKVDLDRLADDYLAFAWENLSPRDRMRVMAGSVKTSWVFGAGASHHYDLNARAVRVPLADGFFKAFHDLPTSEGFHAHVGPLFSYLQQYRNVKALEVSQWTENIEEFMTSVEGELTEIRKKKGERELDKNDSMKCLSLCAVFNNMSFIFANVLNEAQNGPSISLYHYLLMLCGPNDTFVTFNWDTLLDRALADSGGWSPNNGYGLSFPSVFDSIWREQVQCSWTFPTKWKLLKLHGSTNWLVPYTGMFFKTLDYESFVQGSQKVFLYWQSTLPYETHNSRWRGGYPPTCYCYYPPNLPADAFSREELSPRNGYIRVLMNPVGVFSPFKEPSGKGVPSSPLLITPIRQKRYDIYEATIESLWRQSADAMKASDRIIIIGYSFPPTDTRPLELLNDILSAREGEISVDIVAPSAEDIVSRIGRRWLSKAKRFTPHAVTFEDYLQGLLRDVPQLLRSAAKKHAEVKSWLERLTLMWQAGLEVYQK